MDVLKGWARVGNGLGVIIWSDLIESTVATKNKIRIASADRSFVYLRALALDPLS